VLGVLSAQADATRRMAVGQIGNFQRRLEMLHSDGASGFSNGITLASTSSNRGEDAYANLRDANDEASRDLGRLQPRGRQHAVHTYGRLDVAHARLNAFTEHGDDIYSLDYLSQSVNTTTATVGVLAQWSTRRDYGIWAPQLRAEFGHDLQGSSQAAIRYADMLDGPLYRATLYQQSRNHTLLGAGVVLQTNHGWMLRAEYQNQLDNTSRADQSILFGAEKKLGN
jgi:hypothetical protein